MKQTGRQSALGRFREWARRLKRDLKALRIALKEDLVPWYVKVLIIVTVAYALSPVDLIPDFIPVIGLLDDLLIVPLLIFLIIKLIPPEIMQQCREAADTTQLSKKKNWTAGGLIILIWLLFLGWLAMKLMKE